MFIGALLLAIALAELLLGLWFIFGYRRSQATVYYGFFAIAISIYVGANGFGFLGDLLTAQQAEHLAWTGGALTAIFILPLSYSFPVVKRTVRELTPLVVWPLLIIPPAILWTDLIIHQQGIVNFGRGYTTSPGTYFWVFLVFFVTYWIWAIINLFRSYLVSDGWHRVQLNYLLWGLLLSLGISAYFDIYTPLTHVTRVAYVGSLGSSVWLGFTSYILVKK